MSNQMEHFLLVAVATLVPLVLYLWFRRAPRGPTDVPAAPLPVPESTPVPAAVADVPAAADDTATCPPALLDFPWRRAADLEDGQRQALLQRYRQVPRPPRLLSQLLSREFVNEASARELADLIAAEPLLAARVLKAVNSPLYGLPRPVGSIAQAVSLLGLTAVRIVCLRYIFIASFKTDDPLRQLALQQTWTASALASELTQRLAASLGMDPHGQLAGAVVLSFLGRLATVATMPLDQLAALPPPGRLARVAAEQQVLGLGASEIGRLLMGDWGLPAAVVDEAADIDAAMLVPLDGVAAERLARLSLGCLCARLGERLATGELQDLARWELLADPSPEFFRLRAGLGPGRMATLAERLREPALAQALGRIAAGPG